MDIHNPNEPNWYLRTFYPPATQEDAEMIAACINGNIEALGPFLPRVSRSEVGRNATLWAACYNGHLEIVKLLLKHGADPHAEEYGDRCAIYHAASRGHLEIVRLLLDQGVSLRGGSKAILSI